MIDYYTAPPRRPRGGQTASIADRFWPKVDIGPTVRAELGPCWLWTGGVYGSGYGEIFIGTTDNGRQVLDCAHRVSWEMYNGRPIPEDLFVLHKCDVRLCVRPSHLFLGTQAENVHDAVQKDRTNRGERRTHAKLTDESVRKIRLRHAEGETLAGLGESFGVSFSLIGRIVRRERWTHVA